MQRLIAIFDSTFIAQNVYSGEAVEIDHKRNLYRVIIGEDGVSLAEEDAKLAADSRGKTGEISAAEKAIQLHVPAGMTLAQFLALPADQDIGTKITEQERTVEALGVKRRLPKGIFMKPTGYLKAQAH